MDCGAVSCLFQVDAVEPPVAAPAEAPVVAPTSSASLPGSALVMLMVGFAVAFLGLGLS